MKKVNLLLTALLLAQAPSLLAWGSRGHKIVAQVAKKCLDKAVVDSVQYYLGDLSFEDASVWMDEMRSDPSYDYMKPIHYVNVEKDKTYVKVEGPNIVNELDSSILQLLSKEPRSKDKINMALKMLFHLVGDLHQPLHAGYGTDKGGNAIKVDFLGKPSNLHRVWDSDIIDEKNISTTNCLEMINTFSKAEKEQIQKISPEQWMNESRALLPEVYDFKNDKIEMDYVDKNVPVIEKQLAKAGIRLASVLNSAFKKAKVANAKAVTE